MGNDLEPRGHSSADRASGGTTAVVMLHGFTQNGRCLGPLADELARRHTVATPDLPGHGSAANNDATVRDAAAIVMRGCSELAARPHLFGYSLGGRIGLRLALDHPGHLRSLVLLGATPGIADPRERSERRLLDHRRAQAVESHGVSHFVDEWLDAPLFAGLPVWARFEDERRSNTTAGLAGSLRNAGTGSMEPLWNRLGELDLDVLLVAGERDSKFCAIAREMAAAIGPGARLAAIADAGHAAHLEQPRRTAAAVSDFLAEVEAS